MNSRNKRKGMKTNETISPLTKSAFPSINVAKSIRDSLPNPQKAIVPTESSQFNQYDSDGFGELTVQQIREFLQHERNLYLTDEEIINMISNVLMQTDRIKSNDFTKLCKYIDANIKELKNISTFENTPIARHELSLYQEKMPHEPNYGDKSFVHETQAEQDLLNECVNLTTKENDKIVKNMTVVRRQKPHLSKVTLKEVTKSVDYKQLPEMQKCILDMIFSDTLEIDKKKRGFECVPLTVYDDPLKPYEGDMTTEDTPNISILIDDNLQQTNSKQIYKNLFDQYDINFQPVDEKESLCGRREMMLRNSNETECDVWMFEIPQIKVTDCPDEDLIGVFALYDISMEKKLTENYYIDFSREKRKSSNVTRVCINWRERYFKKTEHIIKAVLLLYKEAENDPNAARDAYLKEEKKKKNQQEKAKTHSNPYKQFLGIGVFGVEKILLEGKEPFTHTEKDIPIYREDIEKKQELDAFLKIDNIKSKQLGITWQMTIKKIINKENRVNSEGEIQKCNYIIKDPSGYLLRESSEQGNIIHMLEDFTAIDNYKNFFMDYTNNIYVSPKELNIMSLSPKEKKKTKFVITCYFRCSDKELKDPSTILNSFYSRDSSGSFEPNMKSTISIGNKVDFFLDEFKAKLPLNLNDQHHLFFLIEDVSIDDDKNQTPSSYKYFAYRPLFEQGKIIENGEYTLPIYSATEINGYMTSTTKKEDADKKSFLKINIDIISTIFARKKELYEIVEKVCSTTSFEDIEHVLGTVHNLRPVHLMHFFPVIMKSILSSYADNKKGKKLDKKVSGGRELSEDKISTPRSPKTPKTPTRKMVETKTLEDDSILNYLLKVLYALLKEERATNEKFRQRNYILMLYIDYYFSNKANDDTEMPLFMWITKSLLCYFERTMFSKDTTDPRFFVADIAIEYSWFFFDIIIKSLTLYLEHMQIFDSSNRLERIKQISTNPTFSQFNRDLIQLASTLARTIRLKLCLSKTETNGLFYLNADFSLFINDLSRVYSHSIAFQIMNTYNNILSRYFDAITTTYFEPIGEPEVHAPIEGTLIPNEPMRKNCWLACQMLRVDLFSILNQNEYFYEVNIPLLLKPSSFESVGELRSYLTERHYYSNMISTSMIRLMSRVNDVAKFALVVFIKRLIMCDLDKQFENKKERVAEYFLPFVFDFIEDYERVSSVWSLEEMEKSVIQDFYLCVIWVLKNMNREVLKKYLSVELASKLMNIIKILKTAKDVMKNNEGIFKNDDDKKKYRNINKMYNAIRGTLIDHYKRSFEIGENEKARLSNMFEENKVYEKVVRSENALEEDKNNVRKVVYNKGNDKISQDNNLFGPSPGLGNSDQYRKRKDKLKRMFGEKMEEVSEVVERNKIQDNIIFDDVLLVILDVVDCLFEELIQRKDADDMKKINDFISNDMFVQPPPAQYIKRFFQFIRKLIRQYGDYLFKENLDFLYKLVTGVVAYCNDPNIDIRTNATSVFYLFVRRNYEVLGSTQCMRIHAVASLASLESEKSDFLKRALNTLEQWARDDFSREKYQGQNEEDETKGSSDVIDINAYETYRSKVVKRRLNLLKVINEDKGGENRKWRTKERIVKQLLNVWKDDSVEEVTKKCNELLAKYSEEVKKEEKNGEIKMKATEFLKKIFDMIRDSVAFVGEQISSEEYKKRSEIKCSELQKALGDYEKLEKELGKSIIVTYEKLSELINLTVELVNSRINVEKEAIEVQKEHEQKMKEFESELKKDSNEILKMYCDTCDNLVNNSDDVKALLALQPKLNQTVGKLNAIVEIAKRNHEALFTKENEVMAISSWSVKFKNWNNILPMGVKILKDVTSLKEKLNSYEEKLLKENKRRDEELSASEDLVKLYIWEVSVNDVAEFVVGTHEIEDIISMAGKLNQRFRGINSCYSTVQKYFGDDYKQERSYRMFIELNKEIIPPQQVKAKLLKQMKLLNSESQKDKEYENKRKEYADCFSIAAQLLEFENDEPSSQMTELSQKIKEIENSKIPMYNKYLNAKDVEKLEKFCETHPKFLMVLPFKNETQEHQQSGIEEDETHNKKFGEELTLLQGHIKSFLGDLADLDYLKETNGQAKDIVSQRKYEIAQKYIDCPQIHIPWFERLSKDNEDRGNFVEAGVAIVHVINFIYSAIQNDIHPLNVDYLKHITTDFLDYKQPSYRSGSTSLDAHYLVEAVKKGAQLFEKANLNSFAIDLYNFIIPYFTSNKNYDELAKAHEQVNKLYANFEQTSIWYYYHVGFYGKDFGEEHQKQYIYRSSLRLREFGSAMVEMRKKKLNGIDISPDWKTNVTDIDTDPKRPFITVTNVNPFKDGRKITRLGINFCGSNTFVSEKPIKSEKKHPGLEDTRKIRTVFKTAHSIPSVLERELIVDINETTLSPIECCIDDVDNKLEDLSASIEELKNKDLSSSTESKKGINVTSLQPKLKGILVAEVNGGVGAICDTFLKYPNIELYEIEHVLNLYSLLQRTLFTCKRGLTIHKSNMKPEHAGIQSVFDRGYLATSKIIRDRKTDVVNYAKAKGKEEAVVDSY